MTTHLTLTEETVLYPHPTPEQEAFLNKASALVDDPHATEDQLVALIYGRENPLLDHAQWPGHSLVTAEAVRHPLFRVLSDLIDRKRVALKAFDLDEARSQFTMTVQEAAALLGVHENAIRQAIEARKLPSWRINGRVMLEPGSVQGYTILRRDVPTRLQVRVGNRPDAFLKFKHSYGFEEERSPEKHVVEGIVTKWKRCAVAFGGEGSQTFVAIEPGGEETEITHGPFYIRGRFRVTQRITQAQSAGEAFREFKAS